MTELDDFLKQDDDQVWLKLTLLDLKAISASLSEKRISLEEKLLAQRILKGVNTLESLLPKLWKLYHSTHKEIEVDSESRSSCFFEKFS